MGMFTNGSSAPVTFANFNGKSGRFVVTDKVTKEKTPFAQVRDVVLTKVSTKKDSYEGQERTILQLRVSGGDGDAILSFNTAGGFTARMLAALLVTDPTKPFGLSGQLLEAGTTPKGFAEPLKSDMVSVSVYQAAAGGWVKPVVAAPKAVMVKVGNKEVADTSARDEFVTQAIATLMEAVNGNKPETTDTPHGDDAESFNAAMDDLGDASDIPF